MVTLDLNIDIENDSFAFTPLESTTDEEKTDRSVVRELELQKKLKEVNNIKSIGRENTTYLKNNCSLLKKVLITSEGCNGGKERRDNNNALDVEEGNKSTESLKTNNFKGLGNSFVK